MFKKALKASVLWVKIFKRWKIVKITRNPENLLLNSSQTQPNTLSKSNQSGKTAE